MDLGRVRWSGCHQELLTCDNSPWSGSSRVGRVCTRHIPARGSLAEDPDRGRDMGRGIHRGRHMGSRGARRSLHRAHRGHTQTQTHQTGDRDHKGGSRRGCVVQGLSKGAQGHTSCQPSLPWEQFSYSDHTFLWDTSWLLHSEVEKKKIRFCWSHFSF